MCSSLLAWKPHHFSPPAVEPLNDHSPFSTVICGREGQCFLDTPHLHQTIRKVDSDREGAYSDIQLLVALLMQGPHHVSGCNLASLSPHCHSCPFAAASLPATCKCGDARPVERGLLASPPALDRSSTSVDPPLALHLSHTPLYKVSARP